jgi:hypothetical protein
MSGLFSRMDFTVVFAEPAFKEEHKFDNHERVQSENKFRQLIRSEQ